MFSSVPSFGSSILQMRRTVPQATTERRQMSQPILLFPLVRPSQALRRHPRTPPRTLRHHRHLPPVHRRNLFNAEEAAVSPRILLRRLQRTSRSRIKTNERAMLRRLITYRDPCSQLNSYQWCAIPGPLREGSCHP